MKTMGISEFKAHALRVIDEVSKTRQSVVITRRGRPLAEIVPFRVTKREAIPGRLASMLVFEEDIVSPLGEDMWEASR